MCFCLIYASNAFSQVGYKKDSLQIKVYSEIEYIDRLVKDIKVDTVFCDNCSKNQINFLKEEALRKTYLIRNDEGIKLVNGTYKLALLIRISKKDFLEIKEKKNDN